MYLGYVVSESAYKSQILSEKVVKIIRVRFDLFNNKSELEKIYFQLDYDNVNVIVVKVLSYVQNFIEAGIFYNAFDLEGIRLYDFFRNLHFSESERILACNDLRSTICKHFISSRFCGPEFESLLRPEIYLRCNEMVGLFEEGIYMEYNGNLHYKDYTERFDSTFKELLKVRERYDRVEDILKYFLLSSFVMHRKVVLIGKNFSNIWKDFISDATAVLGSESIEFSHLTFDSCPDNSSGTAFREFAKSKDKFDLIYCDLESDEIEKLNDFIMSSSRRCVRYCVAISLDKLERYRLPIEGRVYPIPSDGFKHVAYVGRILNDTAIEYLPRRLIDGLSSNVSPSGALRKGGNDGATHSTHTLFLNGKLMRLDCMNYFDIESISKYDVNLFTLNRNEGLSIRKYLVNANGVISLFTKGYFSDEEFEVPYCEEILRFSVVDSRIFIGKRISGLKLLVPKNIGIFCDEMLTSVNFKVQKLGAEMLNKYGVFNYNNAKTKAAKSLNKIFVRFPQEFSISDDIMSPSGHAMRLAYHDSLNNDFSVFEYFDKIFYSFSKGVHASKRTVVYKNLGSKSLAGVKAYALVKQRIIELCKESIWHSLDEWLSGFMAYEILTNDSSRLISNIFRMQVKKVEKALGEYYGEDIYAFRNEYSLPISKVIVPPFSNNGVGSAYDITNVLMNHFDEKMKETGIIENFSKGDSFLVKKRTHLANFMIYYLKIDRYVRYVKYHIMCVSKISGGRFSDHDLSKYNYDEMLPYNLYFNLKDDSSAARELCDRAIQLHYARNPHHPEHWKESPMTEIAMKEMICDKLAMQWLKNSPEMEIFYPRRHPNWAGYVPDRLRKNVFILYEEMFQLDDYFLMEDFRRAVSEDKKVLLTHP